MAYSLRKKNVKAIAKYFQNFYKGELTYNGVKLLL